MTFNSGARVAQTRIAGLLLLIAGLMAIPASGQVDLSGEWAPLFHEDQPERLPGPDIGDYLGFRSTMPRA